MRKEALGIVLSLYMVILVRQNHLIMRFSQKFYSDREFVKNILTPILTLRNINLYAIIELRWFLLGRYVWACRFTEYVHVSIPC